MTIALTIACAVSVGGLLLAEYRQAQNLKWIAKPAASACFVLLAVTQGATESVYGVWILAGLALCLVGDVLLIPDDRRSFLAGMAAFALGHAAYIAAFLASADEFTSYSLLAMAAMAAVSTVSLRRLWPHLDAFKWPVAGYTAIIAMMVAASFSAAPGGHQPPYWPAAAGAAMFAISDLAVAQDQFVKRSFFNRLWGLPLYYFAQMLIAASV